MKEDIRKFVEQCIQGDHNPLWPDGADNFCALRCIDKARFCYLFSQFVAEEFVKGELSYSSGDVAMNRLQAVMDPDLMAGFPWAIYLAFDAGEYCRENDSKGIIPWQKYTLPLVMEALIDEGLLPCA